MSTEHPNRIVLWVLYGLGLPGSIATIAMSVPPLLKGDWIPLNTSVLVLALSTITLICFFTIFALKNNKLYKDYCDAPRKIRGLEEDIESISKAQHKIVQTFHNFSHAYRKIAVTLHNDLTDNSGLRFEQRKGMFHGFLTLMITNIKEVFDTLTGDDCSVCIKLLETDNRVGTLMRDTVSERERSDAARHIKKYHYQDNTAFDQILDKRHPLTYFYCNDLQNLGSSYKNGSKFWEKHYNACLVAPIRFVLSSDDNGYEDARVIGFICVDNFKGGFNGNVTRDTLASYADLCFDIFKVYSELDDKERNHS